MKKPLAWCLLPLFLFASSAAPLVAQSGRRTQPAEPSASPSKSDENAAPSRKPAIKRSAPPAEVDTNGRAPERTPPPGADDETIDVETKLVVVPVSVVDREGKWIPYLKKKNFTLYENDVEQPIAFFDDVEKPFSVVLMIDVSNSTRESLWEIKEAAATFVAQLRPDDQVMIVSFAGRMNILTDFTSDRALLRDGIRRAKPGGGTALYSAIDYVMTEVFPEIEGRKAVVLLTDGVDTDSPRGSREQTLYDAEESDVIFFPIRYCTIYCGENADQQQTMQTPFPFPFPGRGRRPPIINFPRRRFPGGRTSGADPRAARAYMDDLARLTGGRLHDADPESDFTAIFTNIADELRHQYSLSYQPTDAAEPGERRRIRVRVDQPGLVVRARDSYITGRQTGTNARQRNNLAGPDARITPRR